MWSPWSDVGNTKLQAARECSQAAAGSESCGEDLTQGEQPVGKDMPPFTLPTQITSSAHRESFESQSQLEDS